jgi:hypothetical protein
LEKLYATKEDLLVDFDVEYNKTRNVETVGKYAK